MQKAIAYYRTSSATNVGPDKDLLERQRSAVEAYAKRAGYEIVESYYDEAVSGADALDARPGFAEALKRIASNGVRTIIVETASRFARDLIVAETGFRRLRMPGSRSLRPMPRTRSSTTRRRARSSGKCSRRFRS